MIKHTSEEKCKNISISIHFLWFIWGRVAVAAALAGSSRPPSCQQQLLLRSQGAPKPASQTTLASPGPSPRPSPSWTRLEHLWVEASSWHPAPPSPMIQHLSRLLFRNNESADIIKTNPDLNGSYNNTWKVHPLDLSINTDVWRSNINGGRDFYRLRVETEKRKRRARLLNK